MLQKTIRIVTFGVLWLFLFSLPVGQRQRLYDVGYFYIVDTKPIHWIVNNTLYLSRKSFDFLKTSTSSLVRGTLPHTPPHPSQEAHSKKMIKERLATRDTEAAL